MKKKADARTFWAGCSLEHFWNLLAHWRAFQDSRHMGRDVVLPSRWSRSSASSKSALAALSSEEAGSGKEAFQVTPLQKCSVPGPSTEHCTCAAGAAAEVLPSTTSRQAAARNRGRCCIFCRTVYQQATEGVDVAPPSAPQPCPRSAPPTK